MLLRPDGPLHGRPFLGLSSKFNGRCDAPPNLHSAKWSERLESSNMKLFVKTESYSKKWGRACGILCLFYMSWFGRGADLTR